MSQENQVVPVEATGDKENPFLDAEKDKILDEAKDKILDAATEIEYIDRQSSSTPFKENLQKIDACLTDAVNLIGEAQVSSLKVNQSWLPIETAPMDGSMILVLLPRMMNLIVRAKYNSIYKHWLTDCESEGIVRGSFFHNGDLWHPMPTLPSN